MQNIIALLYAVPLLILIVFILTCTIVSANLFHIRIFLYEHGGNPNKKNNHNETSLHGVCQSAQARNFVVQQRRAECLTMILQWRGATLKDGEIEKIDLATRDEVKHFDVLV